LARVIDIMNFRKGQRRDEPEINLIAFIDVLLVILIFLMVTTTYSKYTALQITLPTADADKAGAVPRVVSVAVDSQGRYAVNHRRLNVGNPEALAEELKQAAHDDAQAVVEINADALSSHQSVINVLEAARLAGLPRLRFTAQTQKTH
jgi:biopolymer transport protein ExbD